MSQLWVTNSLGGFLSAQKLSKILRHALYNDVKFRQFCDVKDASQQGMRKGDTFHWDVISTLASQGGTLVETQTMPETNFTITQGTLTITEYGIGVPWSGKLDKLSEFPITEIVKKPLKQDAKETFDVAAYDQFETCKLRVVASGGTSTSAVVLTTDGTATATNSVAFGKRHVGAICDIMKERNIPPYKADDYYAIAWPSTLRNLKNDLEGVQQYTTEGFKMLMNGEIGRYNNVRFVEQTNIKKGGAADSTTYNARTTSDAWNNALSDWIFFFGEETVAEAINTPEEIRARIISDYGRSYGIAWYYLGGFGLIHTNAADCRIVKWDSAA